jgi:hypothetical protein
MKGHILCFLQNPALCQIMWKNVVERHRLQMTIWRMRIACWVRKATDTHSEYVMIDAVPLQQLLWKRASLLRYTYIACLLFNFISLFQKDKRSKSGKFLSHIGER